MNQMSTPPMDLTTSTTPTKSTPDTENDTPAQSQPIKPLSVFTNGAVKKHHRHQPPAAAVAYRECLKNHAACLGAHALDGCGEFMPSPAANPSDPTSLKCVACGCHRNFHRRDTDDSTSVAPNAAIHFLEFHRHHPPTLRRTPSPSPPPPSRTNYPYAAPHQMLLALSSAVPDDQQGTTQQPVARPVTPTATKAENPSGRKRIRTKFSQEQKDKMLSFSEKLGWKMQKSDESVVEDFCNEIGVAKGVLKVWMHNNKNTFGKRETGTAITNNSSKNASDGVIAFDNNAHNISNIDNTNSHYGNEITGLHLHVSANGSSPST